MKVKRLATITVLSATILSGGAGIALAQEAREVGTDGKIEFRSPGDEDGELEVVPPEPDPDVEIEPEVPGTTGPLSIVKATTMDFGSQVISNKDEVYNMIAEKAKLLNSDETIPYVSFAQVQDLRGTNIGWDLQVSLSDFESTSQNNILKGAQVELVESRMQYEGNNIENAPSTHGNGLTLIPNGGAQSVMTATKGQGAGTSSVVWGNQEDLNAQFEDEEVEIVKNNAIRLSVPGATAKDATTYKSKLTWELTTIPGNDD